MTQEQRKAYRIAFDFHETRKSRDLTRTARDMAKAASEHGNNPFLNDLLTAFYNQLEREQKERR